jgi:hypothetical protein
MQDKRSLVVCGLSRVSFTTEVLELWGREVQSTQLVWLNRDEVAPELPHGQTWHQQHVGVLADDIAALAEQWGRIVLVLGAGASFAATGISFTALQSDTEPYPFDRDALLQSMREGIVRRAGTLQEPLCIKTVRLMASLHEVSICNCSVNAAL